MEPVSDEERLQHAVRLHAALLVQMAGAQELVALAESVSGIDPSAPRKVLESLQAMADQSMAAEAEMREAVAQRRGWLAPDDAVAAFIRFWRETHGVSQADLAETMTAAGVGWHQATVAEVESATRRRRRVRVDELLTLARVTRTGVADILSWPGVGAELPWGAVSREQLRRLLGGGVSASQEPEKARDPFPGASRTPGRKKRAASREPMNPIEIAKAAGRPATEQRRTK